MHQPLEVVTWEEQNPFFVMIKIYHLKIEKS